MKSQTLYLRLTIPGLRHAPRTAVRSAYGGTFAQRTLRRLIRVKLTGAGRKQLAPTRCIKWYEYLGYDKAAGKHRYAQREIRFPAQKPKALTTLPRNILRGMARKSGIVS